MFTITETSVPAGTTKAEVFLKDFREFDYEDENHYKIYCVASDGVANSSTAVLLNILIGDVGEAPTIDPPDPSLEYEASEGPAGNKIGDPTFVIVDTDSAEIHKWTVVGGTGKDYVNVNVLNGTLSLKKNYDREATTPLPDTVDVQVMIEDRFGLSYNFTYNVTFTDTNDHIPIFNKADAWLDVSRENLTLGDVFLTLNVSDGDAESPNNDITLMLDSSNAYTDYFALNGTDLVYSNTFDLEYGDGPFSFYIFAVDDGATPQTGTATISFGIPEATTALPTTTDIPDQDTGGDEMSTNNNMVYMMIACAFLAALIVGYLLVLCWRWHTYGQCLPDITKGGVDCCSCPKNVDDEEDEIIASVPVVQGTKNADMLGKQYGK
ncbi:protocadherin Fat 3-like [Dreissena polymorpha]|nr:protocadherin Fat 3-like [Dreissena polymorpha]